MMRTILLVPSVGLSLSGILPGVVYGLCVLNTLRLMVSTRTLR